MTKNKKFKKFLHKDALNWAIFIMVAVTMTLKIVEVSSYETLKLRMDSLEDNYSHSESK